MLTRKCGTRSLTYLRHSDRRLKLRGLKTLNWVKQPKERNGRLAKNFSRNFQNRKKMMSKLQRRRKYSRTRPQCANSHRYVLDLAMIRLAPAKRVVAADRLGLIISLHFLVKTTKDHAALDLTFQTIVRTTVNSTRIKAKIFNTATNTEESTDLPYTI